MVYRRGFDDEEGPVDETLFGGSSRRSLSVSGGATKKNKTVITQAELLKMKADSKLWTCGEELAHRRAVEAALEEKQRAARERKARMLALEAKAKAKARKMSDIEMAAEAKKAALLRLAGESKEENLDLVKMLNTLGARAAAFTIRDQQVEERRGLDAKKREYDDRMDLLMEIDRLEDLKKRDSVEVERREKRVEDRKVIVEQIEARQKQKLLAEEMREQDNANMLALVAKYREEDLAAKAKRDEDIRASRIEVVAANEAAISRKELAKRREREEEESILLYQARKDEQLRRREREEQERESAVKERQAKLLAAQERTTTTQDEVDELRARRYSEERERRERARELREAEIKAKRVEELRLAHRRQADQKRELMAREADMQRQEHNSYLSHANALAERERKEQEDKARRAKEHRDVLQQQIEEAREAKAALNRAKREEGQKLKSEFAAERAKLEAIRDKMVKDMEKKGYNPRYLSEIRSVDIEKLQNR